MNPLMEEDQDQEQNNSKKKNNKQHVCKFCFKSFPSGRSLGGHMRSHVINASSSSAETDYREKLLLVASADSEAGYGLRENPKKTLRLYSSGEEHTLFLDKICKECGKGFPSWKSLFGHMKCHSEKERPASNNNNNNTTSFVDDQVQDSSWNNTNTDYDDHDSVQKIVFDDQSDNEGTNTAPNRRKRSKRSRTRYMVAPPPPPSTTSSVFSEIEQEEVVAMSLMMLSKDVGYWGGINSVSDNNNNLLNFDAPSSVIEGKKNNKLLVTNRSDFATKLTKPKGGKSSEIFSNSTKHHKYTSIKENFLDSEAEFIKISHQNKRGKFECTTCNKIFHSYQALGGHRASHKKIKGCFASRNYDVSENSIEFEEPDPSSIITDPTTTAETSKNKHIIKKKKTDNNNNNNNESYLFEQIEEKEAVVAETESKNKGKGFHECPICLKVFTSGQALGGHKRSHMANNGGSVDGGKTCQSQRGVLHESVPEIRDFLDLNLPADTDALTEENISNNSSHHIDVNYSPWWVVGGGNHKQEALVGLNSN